MKRTQKTSIIYYYELKIKQKKKIKMINKDKYKKWSTLIGGILVHLSLGSFDTFGNLSPYLTSYLREMTGSSVRYSNSNWILSTVSISMAISTVLTSLIVSRFKPGLKKVILIGCIIMNTSVALTYFTVKQSFILTLFTYSFTAGIGFGVCYLTPLEIAMKWFPNSKGSANSAILFGYGIGGIIFNQIQTQFINPNNYSPDKSYRYIL
jgi:MFS family permease